MIERIGPMGKHVVYASQIGARLDSHVQTGGGTDDTEALQAVLDRAPALGGLHLVVDGAALIRGLKVHANTTIECLNPMCGFFLAPGSNGSLLMNANPSREERSDRNISIIGGTYNHNCRHQCHHVPPHVPQHEAEYIVVTMAFYGVEDLTIRDVTTRNHRTFAYHITNWQRVHMENIKLDLPDPMLFENQDGLHFQGPGRFLTLRNIQGTAMDDFIAINADEEGFLHPAASMGDITDVLIDGVMVNDAAQAIRILSADSLVDRVVIRNVIGTYRSFGFYLSPWDYKTKGKQGNFGNIMFDTVDLRQTETDYHYTKPFLFRIAGKHSSLTLRNVHYHNPTDSRYVVWIEGNTDIPSLGDTPADVKALTIEGLHIQEDNGSPAAPEYIRVEGHVKHMIVRNSEIIREDDGATTENALIRTNGELAKIGYLFIHDIMTTGLSQVIADPEERIKTVHAHHIHCIEHPGINSSENQTV